MPSGSLSGDGFDCRLCRGRRTAERIGGGNFTWTNFSYLVVNANSGHKEEIKEYITMLLDHDRQMFIKGVGFSVRRDVVRDSVIMVNGVPKKIGKYGLGSIQYLKPDGTTYLEEFLEFLDFVDGCKQAESGRP